MGCSSSTRRDDELTVDEIEEKKQAPDTTEVVPFNSRYAVDDEVVTEDSLNKHQHHLQSNSNDADADADDCLNARSKKPTKKKRRKDDDDDDDDEAVAPPPPNEIVSLFESYKQKRSTVTSSLLAHKTPTRAAATHSDMMTPLRSQAVLTPLRAADVMPLAPSKTSIHDASDHSASPSRPAQRPLHPFGLDEQDFEDDPYAPKKSQQPLHKSRDAHAETQAQAQSNSFKPSHARINSMKLADLADDEFDF